jgi:P27 family predicted phage terminase small subunit
LSKEAQAEWDRIVPELEAMGTLASIDRSVLIRYCTAWGEWCEINEQLNDTGRLVRSQNRTGLVRNPLWFLRSDVEAVLVDLGKQLALSPTSRLRVGIEHQQPEVEEAPKVTAFDKYRQRLGA